MPSSTSSFASEPPGSPDLAFLDDFSECLYPLSAKGPITLKAQEEYADQLAKDNYSLKMKIFFLEKKNDKLHNQLDEMRTKLDKATTPSPTLVPSTRSAKKRPSRGSSAEEEREMLQDKLQAETLAREAAEDEIKTLEEDVGELKTENKALKEELVMANEEIDDLHQAGSKVSEALERERRGRRADLKSYEQSLKADKNSFEQALRAQQETTRSVSQAHARIADLEAALLADRKKLFQQEQNYKDQLAERNSVLLTVWKKLSSMCGSDWAHENSLIHGNLPSQEVIGNMLFWPGFSRNLLLAAKQVEGTLSTIKDRIKNTERELWKSYADIEHTMEHRMKTLKRVEGLYNALNQKQLEAEKVRATSTSQSGTPHELKKLKGENRLLKAELALVQQQRSNDHYSPQSRAQSRDPSRSSALSSTNDGASSIQGNGIPPRCSSFRGAGAAASASAAMAATLMRHHSTNVVEHLASTHSHGSDQNPRLYSITSQASNNRGELTIPAPQIGNQSAATNAVVSEAEQVKFMHRMREMERRLKAEREGRLLDRSGARKRLEDVHAVNEQLRRELEREKMRRGMDLSRAEESLSLPPGRGRSGA